MKTKKQVLKENPDQTTLINAVINRIGMDSIENINHHGIAGGFNGFIYYSDTHAFAMRHRKKIIELLENDASDYGEEIIQMVSNFGSFKGKMDDEDKRELYKYIGGGKCEPSTITNLMAWYAAESVCHWFDE